MTAEDPVMTEIVSLLRERTLVPGHVEVPVGVPVAEWLDSLGRLELVEAIETHWGVDLEETLLGPVARKLDLEALVVLVTAGGAPSSDEHPPVP